MSQTTLIVPLDGSEASERALPIAHTLATALDARRQLVYVLEDAPLLHALPGPRLPDEIAAEHYLQRVAREQAGSRPATFVMRGDPAEELLALAQHTPDSMLVMATHGRGGVGRLIFGSVADKVVRAAEAPVVMVRAEPEPVGEAALNTIIVPLDGSALAETALPLAIAIARGCDATLCLTRVNEPVWRSTFIAYAPEAAFLSDSQVEQIEEQEQTDARAYLEQLARDVRAQGVRVVWEAPSGRPAEEIARSAATTGAGLIVMATHGRGGLRRWALGSVTDETLRRASTPILALPQLASVPTPARERATSAALPA